MRFGQLLRPPILFRAYQSDYFIQRMSTFSTLKIAHDALAETNIKGSFVRTASGFREIISNDHPEFKPEFDRYHLYISLACPWANRCLAVLKMKGLDDCIKHTVVHPTWQRTKPNDESDKHAGWAFFRSGNIHWPMFTSFSICFHLLCKSIDLQAVKPHWSMWLASVHLRLPVRNS